jgi:hypothetical protein
MAWIITLLALVHAYPLARWLLRSPDLVLILLTTLGLSAGSLSLAMLALRVVNIPLTWQPVALICIVVSGVGYVLWQRDGRTHGFAPANSVPLTTLEKLAIAIILIISGLIVFNSIYWPFGIDDAVGIYAYWGKQIYRTATLPALTRESLYEAYPMLVPLWYAFTHSAAGWVDEYLAGLIPALLSVGCFGAAYLLGRELFNRRVGIIAALLCTLVPAVTFWAGAGYTDLPCGFFYGMAGYFLWRARESWRYALLAGIMAGLAAWTKNSGLLIVGSIGLWIVIRFLRDDQKPTLREILLVVGGFIAVAAPWYVRNLLYTGSLLPPTGWTYAAQRTLSTLFPYLTSNRYLPLGALLTAGVIYTFARVPFKRESLYLTAFYLPFFVIWWVLFSYDSRFLLAVLPFVAVMGAHLISVAASRSEQLPPRAVQIGTAGVILVLAGVSGFTAVDHKTELLRYPLMSDAEKHTVRLGGRYQVGLYLRQFPGARVWTQDPIMSYHADGVMVQSSPYPKDRAALDGFDYWIASPGEAVLDGLPEPIYMAGGYRVFRLR